MMKHFTNGLQAKLSLFLCSALLLALPQMSQGATGFKSVAFEVEKFGMVTGTVLDETGAPLPCLLYTSPSPRDGLLSRMPSSA